MIRYPKKILVISYLFPNSEYPEFGIFVLNRIRAISKIHSVTVINPIPWFPFSSNSERYRNFDRIPKKEIFEGIIIYHPRFFIIPRFLKIWDAFSYLLSVCPIVNKVNKTQGFDLIDLHWTYPDILSGIVISNWLDKKMSVTIRGRSALNIFPDTKKEGCFKKEKSLRALLLDNLLPQADMVVSVSRQLEKLTVQAVGSVEKSCVIPNGVSVDTFFYLGKEKARAHLDLLRGDKIILSVGNLIYGKGFDRVFRILKNIKSAISNVKYYVVGTSGAAGDYKKKLNKMVERLNLKDAVKFVGKVDHKNLVLWYNAADVFCLPSRGEGCPNVVLEALACGCPCVATDVGDVVDLICEEYLGKVVSHNSKAIGDALIESLQKDWDHQKISAAMAEYSWDNCAKKVSDVYQEILSS